jgi:golgi-specific brefeldin A-resistance guanine nucleotide exchange factor 1
MVSDGPEQQVVPDNFSGMVTLLDDFASVAGHVVETQQAQGRRKEPLTAAKLSERLYLFLGL